MFTRPTTRSTPSSARSTRCGATRRAGLGVPRAFALCAVAWSAPVAAGAQSEGAALPRCTEARAVTISRIDSASATPGDSFLFKIVELVRGTRFTPEVTPGTRGFGIISFADHAHGSGRPGRLVVEPRFLRLTDGRHVQVMADPDVTDTIAEGETRNLSGALAFVPGLGLAVDGYNALHRGREVVIERGTPFDLLVGDQLALGECYTAAPSALNVR